LAAVELTFDDYMAADHVTYRPSGTTAMELEHTLLKAGVLERRKVVLSAAHSLGLSSIVVSSRLLLTAPKRLALAMIKARSDLQMQDAPFTVSPFHIRSQWHERFDQTTARGGCATWSSSFSMTIRSLWLQAALPAR
jgi:hypothetical protein